MFNSMPTREKPFVRSSADTPSGDADRSGDSSRPSDVSFGEPPPEPPPIESQKSCHRVARITAAASLAIAGATLIGWLTGIDMLTRPITGTASMRVNTALGIVLVAVAVLLLRSALIRERRRSDATPPDETIHRLRTAAIAATTAAAAIGVLTLIEYLAGADLGIDEVLARDPAYFPSADHPGRPSAVTASMIAMIAVAIALTVSRARLAIAARQALAVGTLTLAMIALLSHVYGASVFFDVESRDATALTTAVSLMLVGVGVLCLCSRDGLMRVIGGSSAGGVTARRLLPIVMIGIPLLGLLRLLGERQEIFDDRQGTAVFATSVVVLISISIVWVASQIDRHERFRLRFEAERDRVKAMLDGLVANSSSVIVIEDAEGRYVVVNEAFGKLHKVNPDDLVGRRPEDIAEMFRPEEFAGIQNIRSRLREQRRPFTDEFTFGDDENASTILLQAFPIDDPAGRPLGFGVIATDISERHRQELQLARLNRDLSAETERARDAVSELESFAHTVSHDLRSPLRAIDGFSQIVEQEYRDRFDDRGRHYLDCIRAGAREMGELIDGLLEFSRLGRSELNYVDLDMTELARNAYEMLASEREGRDVRASFADLPPTRGDRRLIGAVFANLLSNAQKYSRPRDVAEIEVGFLPATDRNPVTYFVRDNGVGFKMKYAEKLFGVFERLHRSEDYEGSGVGLATVERIVKRHGGRVWAQSEPDVGTTISFQLGQPRSADRSENADGNPSVSTPSVASSGADGISVGERDD